MEIFNEYLMYKLLFDGDKTKMAGQKLQVGQNKGPQWRGSCMDISQTRQPMRKRLTRRRSVDSASEFPMTDDPKMEKLDQKRRDFQAIGRFATFAEYRKDSRDTPEIQVTPIEQNCELLSPFPTTPLDKAKAKLSRKRSGSLPESQTDADSDKNKLAPPQRFEAAASLDLKRKSSDPCSSVSSAVSTPSSNQNSMPPLISDSVTGYASFENSPPCRHHLAIQRPVSASGYASNDRPLSPSPLTPCMNAVSSPSLLDLYIGSSRRQSREEEYLKLSDEMDSVVLDLGYHYNKPVRYARSAPPDYGKRNSKTGAQIKLSKIPYYESRDPENGLHTPPPTRATVSREASKSCTPSVGCRKNHPFVESIMRKLRSLKRVRPRARSAGSELSSACETRDLECEEKLSHSTAASSSRRRWIFSKSKAPKKMSPPSIFIQNIMGDDQNTGGVEKPKTSGGLHQPTQRPFERTLSYKRSTSAPSPRFSSGRAKSNAADYGGPPKRGSFRNARVGREPEALASDPAQDIVETKVNRKLLSRSNSPLLQPGCSNTAKQAELLVTMCYSQTMGFITATVNKARNVPQNADTFVRVHLFESTKVLERKQTPIVAGKSSPEFKQAYVFAVGSTRLALVHVLIEVFSKDMTGKENILGNVVIGPKAGGTGGVQWLRMMKNANFPCSMWHSLSENY